MSDANDTMTFAQWMHLVNREIRSRCGLTSEDITDWGYRDAYDDGVSPEEAAEEALDNAGF